MHALGLQLVGAVHDEDGVLGHQTEQHDEAQQCEEAERGEAEVEREEGADHRHRDAEEHHEGVEEAVVERHHHQVDEDEGDEQCAAQRAEAVVLPLHVAAPGEAHVGGQGVVAQVGHHIIGHAARAASQGVGGKGHGAHAVHALHQGGRLVAFHGGELGQAHGHAGRVHEQQALHVLRIAPLDVVHADADGGFDARFEQARSIIAGEGVAQGGAHGRRAKAQACHAVAVQVYLQFGRAALDAEADVVGAGDAGEGVLQHLCRAHHGIAVRTAEGDLHRCAAGHQADGGHGDVHAGEVVQQVCAQGHHGGLCALSVPGLLGHQVDGELRAVLGAHAHAADAGAGAAHVAEDVGHFGQLHQVGLQLTGAQVVLLQGHLLVVFQGQSEDALVAGGDKLLGHDALLEHRAGGGEEQQHDAEEGGAVGQHPAQLPGIPVVEAVQRMLEAEQPAGPCSAGLQVLALTDAGGEPGGECEADEEAHEGGDDHHHAELLEQVGHEDLHEDDGEEDHHVHQGDGQGREADLRAAGKGRFALVHAFVQVSLDVLQDHDAVVHQDADDE